MRASHLHSLRSDVLLFPAQDHQVSFVLPPRGAPSVFLVSPAGRPPHSFVTLFSFLSDLLAPPFPSELPHTNSFMHDKTPLRSFFLLLTILLLLIFP